MFSAVNEISFSLLFVYGQRSEIHCQWAKISQRVTDLLTYWNYVNITLLNETNKSFLTLSFFVIVIRLFKLELLYVNTTETYLS